MTAIELSRATRIPLRTINRHLNAGRIRGERIGSRCRWSIPKSESNRLRHVAAGKS